MSASCRALRVEYSRFEPGGVSRATVTSERSLSGMKPPPPNITWRAMAPTNAAATMPTTARRWSRAQAMTRL